MRFKLYPRVVIVATSSVIYVKDTLGSAWFHGNLKGLCKYRWNFKYAGDL